MNQPLDSAGNAVLPGGLPAGGLQIRVRVPRAAGAGSPLRPPRITAVELSGGENGTRSWLGFDRERESVFFSRAELAQPGLLALLANVTVSFG